MDDCQTFRRLQFHRQRGFKPMVIYDIGAHIGSYSRQCKHVFTDAQYELFEANSSLDNHKKDFAGHTHTVLLGDTDYRLQTFYKSKTPFSTGNSMFRENTVYFDDDNVEREQLCQMTLDSFVTMHKLPLPDFMKLDVQGAELCVLRGASMVMQHCNVIAMEVALHPYNAGAPLLAEVVQFMDARGYRVLDVLEPIHMPSGGVNIQVDLLFVRPALNTASFQYAHVAV